LEILSFSVGCYSLSSKNSVAGDRGHINVTNIRLQMTLLLQNGKSPAVDDCSLSSTKLVLVAYGTVVEPLSDALIKINLNRITQLRGR
jgi:hypothetical protein